MEIVEPKTHLWTRDNMPKKKPNDTHKISQIRIGKYTISRYAENSIWIEHESGEGGMFKEDLLEKYIEAFYKRFF